jgi:hypothetical protein
MCNILQELFKQRQRTVPAFRVALRRTGFYERGVADIDLRTGTRGANADMHL